METIIQDLRFALRMLAKNPGYTAVAVLTLALGIGVNLALFALLNDQLLRPRAVRNPDELWAICPAEITGDNGYICVARPYYEAIRKDGRVFSGVIGYCNIGPRLRTADGWETVKAVLVSGDFFSFLGVQPLLGRGFLPEEDDKPGTHCVAVISYRFWQQHFQDSPDVLGKTITVEKQKVEIVGVAPRDFKGISLYDRDLWLPSSMEKTLGWQAVFSLLGRLKHGVSPTQAAAALAPVVQEITKTLAASRTGRPSDRGPQFVKVDLLRAGYGSLPAEWARFGWKDILKGAGLVGIATLLVLLIAATNLANLLLARALSRRKEMATRLALGASRWSLIRQFLFEGLLLAGLGSMVAMLLLVWLNNAPAVLMPGAVYANADLNLRPDLRVVAFALVSALLVGVGFSLLPALHASRLDPFVALKDPEGGTGLSERHWSLRKLLMVAQIAASLILLSGVGLCLRAISEQLRTDVGFRPEPIVMAEVDLESAGFTEDTAPPVVEELRRRFSLLPGVEAVGVMDMIPLVEPHGHMVSDQLEGYVAPAGGPIEFGYAAVGPDCFRALGIPLVEGREATANDFAPRRPVAMVNESFVRKFWANQTVPGKRLLLFRESYEVIGVVRDARINDLTKRPEPTLFFSVRAWESLHPNFIVRARQNPKSLIRPIAAELAGIHPRLRQSHIRTLEQFMLQSLSAQRDARNLLGQLAALALTLTVLGIYGMMSYLVAQRTREIGIRMALGAGRSAVAKLVLRSGFGLALAGIGLGLPAAIGGASLLRHAIYGVSVFEWPAFGVATVFVLLAILLACWLPARRASKIDPMVALRCE